MGEEEVALIKKDKPAVDLVYAGNSAGQVVKGMGTILSTPVPLAFSGGAGLLNLNYLRKPVGFVTASTKLDTNLGSDWNIYGRTVVAMFPSGDQIRGSYYEASNFGATYDIIPARGNRLLRAGVEAATKFFETENGGLQQQYETLSAGVAFGYRRLIAYGIASVLFTDPTLNEQYWTADLRPWPEQARAGAVVNIGNGNEIGAELNASKFEEGGKLSFKMGFLPTPALLALTYRHTQPAFGNGNEVGVSAVIQLDREVSRIMVRASQEVGGSSLNEVKNNEVYNLSQGAVGEYLYSINRISAAQMIQMVHGNATIESSKVADIGGRQVTTVSYSVSGKQYTYDSPSSLEPLNQNARASLGQTDYNILQAMFTSSSLQDFANHFANSSTDEKIYIASKLARLGQNGYNTVLENMSPFQPGKGQLATITPQVEFANIQKSFLENKKLDNGICGNINGLAAEFLRDVGVEAYSLVVNGHVIAAARDEKGNASYVINYGLTYKTPGSGMWPAVQAYSRDNGVILLGAFVYGNHNEYLGYYKGPESRLLDTVLQTDEDMLKEVLIRKK